MQEKIKSKVPVITLDGPSGTGKGTLCHRLADYLGWHILDSGVLYRALAYLIEARGIAHHPLETLVSLAEILPIRFEDNHIFLGDVAVEGELRTEACGARASKLASMPEIRAALLERQRAFAVMPGLVTDGRDMGTVVFPGADLKIYLDATAAVRAERRYLQLNSHQKSVSLAQVVDELAKRDARDMAREHAPLKVADHAVVVDTTHLDVDGVFEHLLELVHDRGFVA
jgi:CMP/dCMP kinase